MGFHFGFWDVALLVLLAGAVGTPIYKVAEQLQRMNDRLEERDAAREAARAEGDD